jgi:hypothetical protein
MSRHLRRISKSFDNLKNGIPAKFAITVRKIRIKGSPIYAVQALVAGLAGGCGFSPEPPKRVFTRSRNCWNVT